MVPVPEDKRTLNFVKGNRHLRHTTLVGGIPDYDDVSGWLLLVGDADGHVGLIWSLATNRELLGSVGRHYIGWRHVAEQAIPFMRNSVSKHYMAESTRLSC
jgi:hypothetical protein